MERTHSRAVEQGWLSLFADTLDADQQQRLSRAEHFTSAQGANRLVGPVGVAELLEDMQQEIRILHEVRQPGWEAGGVLQGG